MDIQRHANKGPVYMDLDRIKEGPGPFTISFGFFLDPLIQSIKDFGLINPPYVTKNREGQMDVIMGYRRITALKSIGWKSVPVFDLSDCGLSAKELFLCNLQDNLVMRSFNPVEKGMILKRLSNYFSKQEISDRYISLLGITSLREIDFFLELDDQDGRLKEAVIYEKISPKAVRQILKMDGDSRSLVTGLITDLNLNFNQQLQFIEYITDVSKKENQTISGIINQAPFMEILCNNHLNKPQKTKKILGFLKWKKYPLLTQTETAFNKMISDMNLPKRVRMIHPPFFEASDYRLEISFKTGQELKESLDQLSMVEKIEHFSEPWEAILVEKN